jgi:uncharacterized repeat protein (TIGR03803 family)
MPLQPCRNSASKHLHLVYALLLGIPLLFASACGGGGANGGTPPASPTITSVKVTCASTTVPTGQTSQCSATVSGTGNYSSGITWAVNGTSGGSNTVGTVSTAGLYTAPNTVPTPFTVSVSATSSVDATKSASASLVIAGTIATVSQTVSSASGGTISLPDGSGVTIGPGILPSDQIVTLTEISSLPAQPQNAALSGVGPGLTLSFGTQVTPAAGTKRLMSRERIGIANSVDSGAGTSSSATPAFQFSINTANNASARLNGSFPAANFVDSARNNTFLGASGNYDSTTAVVTASVGTDQWEAYLVSASNNLVSIVVSAVNFIDYEASVGVHLFTAPSKLILNQDTWTQWANNPPNPPCPSGRILVVVHGMNDYVEDGFSASTSGNNPQVIQDLLTAGNYNGAFGFDYDWTQDIKSSGAQLAQFLNSIVTNCTGVTSIDVEAHSEGVPVTMSAWLPKSGLSSASKMTIKRIIGLGGPIMGTPIASDARDLGTLLMAMSALNMADNIVVDGMADLLTKPFVVALQPSEPGNGDELDTIRTSLSSASIDDQPQIIVVAGNSAQAASGALGSALRVCGAILQGQGATYSDGFIPVSSALAFQQPNLQQSKALEVYPLYPFPTDHLDLIKSQAIQNDVGIQVKAQTPFPSLAISSSQCSDALVCSAEPGEVYWMVGTGYGTNLNPAYELDQTGNVTKLTSFSSSDGSIPANSWVEPTNCSTTPASEMYFSENALTSLQSNAVTAEVVSGSCALPSIVVSPSSVQVPVGGSQQFSANELNIPSSIIWTVNGVSGGNTTDGTIESTGLYTAPAAIPNPPIVTIAAISTVDSSVSGPATVTIIPEVTISPSSITVPAGLIQTFSATVAGGGTVTWSIQEGTSGGSITSTGIYTAPAQTGTYHVVATNAANSSESATATVNVVTGPSITTIHSFNHTTEGANPWAAPAWGSDGDMYGVTEAGGDLSCAYASSLPGCGTIYKSDTSGNNVATLHSFVGTDGAYPIPSLLAATGGMFYGTTFYGGSNTSECDLGGTSTLAGCGSVFSYSANAGFASVLSFGPFNSLLGVGSVASLVQTGGTLYGTNEAGGNTSCTGTIGGASESGCGAVFSISSSNVPSALHTFAGSEGAYPTSGLLQSNGYLYGTTEGGGTLTCSSFAAPGCGTIFQMNLSGTFFKTLHSFTEADGAVPWSPMILAADGNIYGTTIFGGSAACSGGAQWQGCGTVFKIDTGGNFESLHSFSGPDGAYPTSIMQASDGYFYGTTEGGGDASCSGRYGPGCGTVFRMDSDGNVTILYAFTDKSDGSWPESAVIQGTDGNLYGTAVYGGVNDDGVIFQISNLTSLAADAMATRNVPDVRQAVTPLLVRRPHVGPPGPPVSTQP